MMTLHASGGAAMMRAAREALGDGKKRPMLLGVTILTSLDQAALEQIGLSGSPGSRALALAQLAKESGMDGVVASAHEVEAIREACGPDFLIVVPGVRPASAELNDQSRVATPERCNPRRCRLSGSRPAHHRSSKSPRRGSCYRE